MPTTRPNILFIMSDDHAAHAISAYGSRINRTPHLDRIASGGMRLTNCFCTNSICAPSRAAILTGTYNHINGVETLRDKFDGRQQTYPKLLQAAGYQTAIVGKWHLGHGGIHDPTGFDYWNVLPGQGKYHDPDMIEMGETKVFPGYVTDIITDLSLDWLRRRDPNRPFALMVHHKAPHRPWEPDDKHAHLYDDLDIVEPETIDDDYSERAPAARAATMRIERDLNERDLKQPPPEGLSERELKAWKYQRFIKDYLRCIASIDDNVGRLLDFLDEAGLAEDTVVIYTSDQGFFLGDHGWFDKRFFYEESLRMPFLIRYPREIPAGTVDDHMVLNVDFAPLFLDYAGLAIPHDMQGLDPRAIFQGEPPPTWRDAMYYRYFMHVSDHNVYAHYGIRTLHHKLIYYYLDEPEPAAWELFNLDNDLQELHSLHDRSDQAETIATLKGRLHQLRVEVGDLTNPWPNEGAE